MTKSRQGDLPIHIACRYQADRSVLETLTRHYPGTACQRTRWGATPIAALWEQRRRELTLCDLCDRLADRSIGTAEKLAALPSAPLPSYGWQATQVLLEAVAKHRQQQQQQQSESYRRSGCDDNKDDTLFIVHAAVSLGSTGCPLFVLFYAVRNYGDQVAVRDQNGQLPLHIAIGRDNSSHPNSLWKFKPREYD